MFLLSTTCSLRQRSTYFFTWNGVSAKHANDMYVLFKLTEAEWRKYASANQPQLVQIMACRLAGAKPLCEPMLEYC